MHSSFSLLFFQKLQLWWLLSNLLHFLFSFLQIYHYILHFGISSLSCGSSEIFPNISQPVPLMLDFIKGAWRHVSKQCLNNPRVDWYYTKPAPICQRPIPSGTDCEPTQPSKHNNCMCAMSDLIISARLHCFFSLVHIIGVQTHPGDCHKTT